MHCTAKINIPAFESRRISIGFALQRCQFSCFLSPRTYIDETRVYGYATTAYFNEDGTDEPPCK